jgi:DNA-binding response OmpR family regulator
MKKPDTTSVRGSSFAHRKQKFALLLVGTESAFDGKAFDCLFGCDCICIVARSSSLMEAMTSAESQTIDMVLLSGEYREIELTLFALDARHRGFQGLILRAADIPSQISLVEQQEAQPIQAGEFFIDVIGRRVWFRGNEMQLCPREFTFLKFLSRHPEELLSHRTLLESQWGNASVPADRLRTLVRALRKKIENTTEPRYLLTERHLGYRFVPSPPKS